MHFYKILFHFFNFSTSSKSDYSMMITFEINSIVFMNVTYQSLKFCSEYFQCESDHYLVSHKKFQVLNLLKACLKTNYFFRVSRVFKKLPRVYVIHLFYTRNDPNVVLYKTENILFKVENKTRSEEFLYGIWFVWKVIIMNHNLEFFAFNLKQTETLIIKPPLW